MLAWAALQAVPLPPAIVDALSPARAEVVGTLSLQTRPGWVPLTLDPASSRHALLVLASGLAVFWCARSLFHVGGIRTVARATALWGLAASIVGILQDASRTRLIYWWWAPVSDGPPGFGPFVNRNHFAAWTVMALALTVGYLAARTHARDDMDRFRSFAARLRRRFDFRTLWLLLAIAAMGVALVVTLSRSGLAAGAAALVTAHLAAGGRRRSRRLAWIAGTAILVVAILWTGPAALLDRWQSMEIGQEGRSVIWRETMPIVRAFPLTGTGVGTYGIAMTVYQQTDKELVHFNQAHNHYLQVLAEGGVLLLALCAAAAWFLVRAAAERLADDHTGMLWLRAGAAAGLIGLAVSSVWETAARMPANALLAAVLAAVVLHDTHHHHHPEQTGA